MLRLAPLLLLALALPPAWADAGGGDTSGWCADAPLVGEGAYGASAGAGDVHDAFRVDPPAGMGARVRVEADVPYGNVLQLMFGHGAELRAGTPGVDLTAGPGSRCLHVSAMADDKQTPPLMAYSFQVTYLPVADVALLTVDVTDAPLAATPAGDVSDPLHKLVRVALRNDGAADAVVDLVVEVTTSGDRETHTFSWSASVPAGTTVVAQAPWNMPRAVGHAYLWAQGEVRGGEARHDDNEARGETYLTVRGPGRTLSAS